MHRGSLDNSGPSDGLRGGGDEVSCGAFIEWERGTSRHTLSAGWNRFVALDVVAGQW